MSSEKSSFKAKLAIGLANAMAGFALWGASVLITEMIKIKENNAERDKQIVALQASAFTLKDSNELKTAIMHQIAGVNAHIETLQSQVAELPKQSPPDWFLENYEKLEKRVVFMENRLYEFVPYQSGRFKADE